MAMHKDMGGRAVIDGVCRNGIVDAQRVCHQGHPHPMTSCRHLRLEGLAIYAMECIDTTLSSENAVVAIAVLSALLSAATAYLA